MVIDRLIDILDLFLGFTAGILISTISFLLTYRHSWRNWITNEFTVRLEVDFAECIDDLENNRREIKRIRFKYYINCTQPDGCYINYLYIKMPKSIKGNSLSSATVAEMIFNRGAFFIEENPEFKGYLTSSFFLPSTIIQQLQDKRLTPKVYVVVNSNKYGNVRSNSIKLSQYSYSAYSRLSWLKKLFRAFKRP